MGEVDFFTRHRQSEKSCAGQKNAQILNQAGQMLETGMKISNQLVNTYINRNFWRCKPAEKIADSA